MDAHETTRCASPITASEMGWTRCSVWFRGGPLRQMRNAIGRAFPVVGGLLAPEASASTTRHCRPGHACLDGASLFLFSILNSTLFLLLSFIDLAGQGLLSWFSWSSRGSPSVCNLVKITGA